MKIDRLIFMVFAFFLILISCKNKSSESNDIGSTIMESPYLGQKLPGVIPEPFAPGLVTTLNWEIDGVFTPDLKEFYFIREVGEKEEDKKMEFVVIQYKNNQWQDSVISPRVGQPFISPDGKIMHLGRRYKERTDAGWSEIKKLDTAFMKIPIMRLTSSAKGTYVFDEMSEQGNIRYSRLICLLYTSPSPRD